MGSSMRDKASARRLLTQHSTVALKPLNTELQEMPEDMRQVLLTPCACHALHGPIVRRNRFPLRAVHCGKDRSRVHEYLCSGVSSQFIVAGES